MKLIAIMMAVLISLYSAGAQAEFERVADGRNLSVYADKSTIINSGVTSKIWIIFNYHNDVQIDGERQTYSYKSILSLEEFDCTDRKVRSIKSIFYSDMMATGELVYEIKDSGKWDYVTPASVVNPIIKLACVK